MEVYKTDRLDLRNMDCMELMKEFPDNHFDLAVVDPPYGIGVNSMNMGSRSFKPTSKRWDDDIPSGEYFTELFRCSKNQIIWGGNYFPLIPTKNWLIWDKGESMYGRGFAEGEMAWSSLDHNLRLKKIHPNQLDRIHPTQKPVKLYEWILTDYAEEGFKLLDTHMGSGSIAIASHYANMHLTACELDEDYFKAACKRIKKETSQLTFDDWI